MKWVLIEKTMYGQRPAKIYVNKKGRYKIDFYYLISGKFMCSNYYKKIPSYIAGSRI